MSVTGGRSVTATARRAQIVSATIDTIAELGYGAASFARIAERAGLSSTRLISYHFAGKDELMAAVVESVYGSVGAHMTERVAGQPDAASTLRAYIEGLVGYLADHRAGMSALTAIFLNWGAGGQSYDATDRDAIGQLEAILRYGQRTGEFREFDTFVMASTIQRAIDVLPFALSGRPELDLDGYARELVALFAAATRSGP